MAKLKTVTKKKVLRKEDLLVLNVMCPNLEKRVSVKVADIDFTGHSDECEMCGSHGGVELSFFCKCGNTHEVELSSW